MKNAELQESYEQSDAVFKKQEYKCQRCADLHFQDTNKSILICSIAFVCEITHEFPINFQFMKI